MAFALYANSLLAQLKTNRLAQLKTNRSIVGEPKYLSGHALITGSLQNRTGLVAKIIPEYLRSRSSAPSAIIILSGNDVQPSPSFDCATLNEVLRKERLVCLPFSEFNLMLLKEFAQWRMENYSDSVKNEGNVKSILVLIKNINPASIPEKFNLQRFRSVGMDVILSVEKFDETTPNLIELAANLRVKIQA